MSRRFKILLRSMLVAAFAAVPAVAQEPISPQPPAGPPAAPAEEVREPAGETQPAVTTPLGHVEQRGSGPIAMILIPGLVADWSIFEEFTQRNAEKYTMYAVTLPGFGGTEAPPDPGEESPFTDGAWLENATRAILQLVREKQLERPVAVGQSLGGQVALRLVAQDPELFRGAVILNGMPAYPIDGPGATLSRERRATTVNEVLPEQIRGISEEEWAQQQRAWILDSTMNQERAAEMADKAAGVPKHISTRYMLEYLGADISDKLAEVQTPILVIAGIPDIPGADLDEIRAMWPELYAGVPKATIVYFEATGEVIPLDAPAELDRAIEQFLAGQAVEGKKKPEAPAEPGEGTAPAPAVPPGEEKQPAAPGGNDAPGSPPRGPQPR